MKVFAEQETWYGVFLRGIWGEHKATGFTGGCLLRRGSAPAATASTASRQPPAQLQGNRQHSFKASRRNTSVGVAHNADAETGIGKLERDDLTRVQQTAFSVSLPIGQTGAILILYEEWQFYFRCNAAEGARQAHSRT